MRDKFKDLNTGIGEVIPKHRCCDSCGGPWDIAKPVRRSDGKWRPHPDGVGLCWDCYDRLCGVDTSQEFKAGIIR